MSKLEGRIEKLETKKGYQLTTEQVDACRRAALLGFPAKDGESEEALRQRLEEFVREDMRKGGCL